MSDVSQPPAVRVLLWGPKVMQPSMLHVPAGRGSQKLRGCFIIPSEAANNISGIF